MTVKEKAEELALKYLRLQEPNYNWFHKGLAKECALIAVDEILDANPYECDGIEILHSNISYWEEVKKEIEKL
jgi:nitrogenase molybdenum-iron protein alpha/beta subunit